MKRAFILILDSLGIGASKDAYKFGDDGADTLGHIAEACFKGKANINRKGLLYIPNLTSLGLAKAANLSTDRIPLGLDILIPSIGAYGYASEISSGKDTTTGHWEIAGVPVLFNWDYFESKYNSFPEDLLNNIVQIANLPGYLGNCHASGTDIINELGEIHLNTGKPIFYTSADSVFQVACHEKFFGLHKIYKLCEIIRKELTQTGYNISRVIARPFIGTTIGSFERTGNRLDLSMSPPSSTIFKKLVDEKSGEVIAIGKIADIYCRQGITKKITANGINELFEATITAIIDNKKNNLIVITNFVDFDSMWGHRRNIAGYAKGLELFDRRLPEIISIMEENDILIITADHGCDPSWIGTDHTREHIPILIYGHKIDPICIGYRTTFADIGQTLASYFNISPMKYGKNIF
ncbi:phosphopentomutase [Candidatus Ishikawella capsulata]|uniref:Phosphopentomutase n=1 Tax=Candidatus Ishikawaella capsulata Mpkobe TaxID=476281 RepID=C5WDK3_9ENTR|nr:phosphopentomutase [Candidatus Ishikawaella capsulata]BAH83409.1 phosphopentomutase [Candidatus Ishikawaella capsulata Mpkobe]